MYKQNTNTMPQMQRHNRRVAFTLVELLVVLLVIGVLFALLLPAVQSAREATRRVTCQNRIRQLAMALRVHHDSKSHFPFGGWGRRWSGVPGRGSGQSQPGGWIYSILPQLEQSSLHSLGSSGGVAEREAGYSSRMRTPVAQTYCPSRRSASLLPISKSFAIAPLPHGQASEAARSDYAINSGSSNVVTFPGPTTFGDGDSSQWWERHGTSTLVPGRFSGIIHYRSGVPLRRVKDGAGNTYLLGEKYLHYSHYESGLSPGDDASPYSGYSFNTHRFAGELTFDNEVLHLPPLPDTNAEPSIHFPFARFGGPHPSTFQMALCDGAVRATRFDIAPEIHRQMGSIDDGEIEINAFE